jgi:Na+/proline symporter
LQYTAIGDLFEHYVGGERIGIIIFVGTTTALYTASGGLLVSIVTDQAQVRVYVCVRACVTVSWFTQARLAKPQMPPPRRL